MSFSSYLTQCQTQVDHAIKKHLSDTKNSSPKLLEAMEYSLFNGGKRVRPVLVYAAAQACEADLSLADTPAAAIEMIHSYSLVHDDLPAMDDDDLRRGKPTCHIAFDEATAILAGDALQTQAFQILSEDEKLTEHQRLAMIRVLSQCSGAQGMAAGQCIDLAAVGQQVGLEYLENMHQHKTGALIRASVVMGAHCQPNVSQKQLHALEQYAEAIGLAFQVQDDILDVISDTATLGKTQGADAARDKPTYISLLGLEGAQHKASELHQQAIAALDIFGASAQPLKALADYIIERSH